LFFRNCEAVAKEAPCDRLPMTLGVNCFHRYILVCIRISLSGFYTLGLYLAAVSQIVFMKRAVLLAIDFNQGFQRQSNCTETASRSEEMRR
jgi:hypothetical protein